MTIEELMAREEIRHLMAVYNTAGDSLRQEEFGSVFTDDAELFTAHATFQGKAAILEGLFRSVSKNRTVVKSPKFVRHNLTTSKLTIEGDDTAKGRTYFQVNTDIGLDHCGIYIDEFHKVEGEWKIFRRVVRTEYVASNSYFQ